MRKVALVLAALALISLPSVVPEARMPHYKLEPAGVKRGGDSSEVDYRDYGDFLVTWSVIEDIDRVDVGKIAADAAAYRYAR